MVSVKYDNVKIAYDDFIAIQGVTLDIPDGEITTLLGPSGCGKSTLLRSLAGFVEPFEGRIYIGDNEVTILPPQKRNTAMIFQNYALWPHMTILENVEYGMKIRRSDEQLAQEKPWFTYILWIAKLWFLFVKIAFWFAKVYAKIVGIFGGKEYAKRITSIKRPTYNNFKAIFDKQYEYRRGKAFEALRLVHLEDQADKHPTELSGGQQQRIALARSIVVEPDVLLCDEPLSNLDAKLRKELRTEIRSIIKKIGMTAIYVTHDQAEALAISDRIAVMNIGFIEQYGTPTEVFTNPKTLFVGQFIGSSSTLTGKAIASNLVELPGGEQVRTMTKASLVEGTDVSLVVRPDVISLLKTTDSPIDFTINTIEYLGEEVKITGLLRDGTLILVNLEEQKEKYSEMKVGDIVRGYVNPEEVFVFVDEKRVY